MGNMYIRTENDYANLVQANLEEVISVLKRFPKIRKTWILVARDIEAEAFRTMNRDELVDLLESLEMRLNAMLRRFPDMIGRVRSMNQRVMKLSQDEIERRESVNRAARDSRMSPDILLFRKTAP